MHHPTKNKPGVALIGIARENYGLGAYMAKLVMAHPHVELVAIGGRSLDRMERFVNDALKSGYGKSIKAFGVENIETLFTLEEVDLVIIASPDATHLEYLRYGIKHHKNIWVEKPILPLSENPEVLEELFSEADKKGLSLSTNCQRAYIPLFLECPKPQKNIEIKVVMGIKNKVEDIKGLTNLLISHPVSILVNLGLDVAEAYTNIGYSTPDTKGICFDFNYGEVAGKIRLEQAEQQKFTTVYMQLDNDIIRVTPIEKNAEILTEYRINDRVLYSEDLLKVNFLKLTDYLMDGTDKPVVDNRASLQIAFIQYRFYSLLTAH